MVALRRNLLDRLGTLRKLCAELDPPTAQCASATLDALRSGITSCEQRMLECIAAVLFRRAAILGSVPGCGRLMAACLTADMPVLGTLGYRQAVSMPSLAA